MDLIVSGAYVVTMVPGLPEVLTHHSVVVKVRAYSYVPEFICHIIFFTLVTGILSNLTLIENSPTPISLTYISFSVSLTVFQPVITHSIFTGL